MDYFYALPKNVSRYTLTIVGEEFAHLTHVMRKKVGDTIRVVNGIGTAYDVYLEDINKKTATGKILAVHSNHHEPNIALTLAVGILKNPSKFDFLVEKVTELGVKEIVPLRTGRTIPSHSKTERWQRLTLSAMKQSGRSYLPEVREMITLDKFLETQPQCDLKLVAHEKADPGSISEKITARPFKSAALLIGPEGGFSDEEIERCVAVGFKQIYFGERRLRTETAAIVAVAKIILSSY